MLICHWKLTLKASGLFNCYDKYDVILSLQSKDRCVRFNALSHTQMGVWWVGFKYKNYRRSYPNRKGNKWFHTIPYHVTRYTLTNLSFIRSRTIIYMYVRIVYGSNVRAAIHGSGNEESVGIALLTFGVRTSADPTPHSVSKTCKIWLIYLGILISCINCLHKMYSTCCCRVHPLPPPTPGTMELFCCKYDQHITYLCVVMYEKMGRKT